MNISKYLVKDEDMRNLENNEKVMRELLLNLNPPENIIVLDYSNIHDPQVSSSTGIICKSIIEAGFPKLIISGHPNKSKLMENFRISTLVHDNKLEIQ